MSTKFSGQYFSISASKRTRGLQLCLEKKWKHNISNLSTGWKVPHFNEKKLLQCAHRWIPNRKSPTWKRQRIKSKATTLCTKPFLLSVTTGVAKKKFWDSFIHVCNRINVTQGLREIGLAILREIHFRVVVYSKRRAKIHNGSVDLRSLLWSLWFSSPQNAHVGTLTPMWRG